MDFNAGNSDRLTEANMAAIPSDLAEIWSTLTTDSGADAAIVTVDGRVLYMSQVLSWWAPTRPFDGVNGKLLADLFPKAIADERIQLIRRVAETGKPLVIHAAWKGIRTRTVMRPLRSPNGAIERVLIVCRGMVPADDTRAAQADMEIVQAQHVDKGQLAHLTPRELEILALIGQGLTTAAIAEKLFRSRKTIEAHRLSLGIKLSARNRVDLARIAVQSGLVPPDLAMIERTPRKGRPPKNPSQD
jgi:DNA-binding CsgD family transcriptional regulator